MEETLQNQNISIAENGRIGLSRVWKARKSSNDKIAVKIVTKSKREDKAFAREVKLLSKLSHPSLVQLIDSFEDHERQYMVFPLYKEDLLTHVLSKERTLTEQEARGFFTQIIDVVRYCHENHVAHRDLKLENFLVEGGMLYLSDFEFAAVIRPGKLLTKQCGSLAYSAPELLAGKPYSGFEVDMWSLGIILYVLVYNVFPFLSDNIKDMAKLAKCPIKYAPTCSLQVQDLMSMLLQRRPSQRAKWGAVLSHPWLYLSASSSSQAPCPSPC